MAKRKVVRMKDGEARIVSTKRWMELIKRMGDAAEAAARAGNGACEEACEEHEGVADCGQTFVYCNDGSAFLLDP